MNENDEGKSKLSCRSAIVLCFDLYRKCLEINHMRIALRLRESDYIEIYSVRNIEISSFSEICKSTIMYNVTIFPHKKEYVNEMRD